MRSCTSSPRSGRGGRVLGSPLGWLATSAGLVVGAGASGVTRSDGTAMDLDAYRAAAQAFATDLNRAHHRRFAGHDGAWDPDSLYGHHAAAYDDAAIETLREAAAAETATEAAGGDGVPGAQPARRLLRFAVEARLGNATALTDAASRAGRSPRGLADLTIALAAETAVARRVELEEQRLDIVARRLTPLAAEGLERVRAETRTLGWPSPRALLCDAARPRPGRPGRRGRGAAARDRSARA